MFDPGEIKTSSFVGISDEARLTLLNAQLAHALRSPYYREALSGLLPLPSLDALSALPLTDAHALRREGNRLCCVSAGEVARIVSLPSSGSTGSPKRLYFTEGDLLRTRRFFAEGMGWMCAPGDTAAVLMPAKAPDGIGDLLCRGLSDLGATPLPLGDLGDFVRLKAALTKAKPHVLVGFPWQIRLLALTLPELRPRAVLLSGDYAAEGLRTLIAERWQTRVMTHFGMTETGYGCAVQHPTGEALYLRRDELIAEIIDTETLRPLLPGAVGELVLTTLKREAMPLIRYRTGDLAAIDKNGDLAALYGRRATPEGFYALQNAFSPLPWLLDYRTETESIFALLSPEAPENAGKILAERSGLRAETEVTPVEKAAPLFFGKRPIG